MYSNNKSQNKEKNASQEIDELIKDIQSNINISPSSSPSNTNNNNNINTNSNNDFNIANNCQINFSSSTKKWKENIDFSYHFKQNIERVYVLVKNFEMLSIISNKGHYPVIFAKGSNTWTVGTSFEGKLFGKFDFKGKVLKVKNLPEFKKITWGFYCSGDQQIQITLKLFKVSDDNTCVLLWKSKMYSNKENNDFEESFRNVKVIEILKEVEHILESEPINLMQYESGIITAKMEEAWSLITDAAKLNLIAPNNYCIAPFNIKDIKIGEKTKIPFTVEGNKGELEIKMETIDDKPGWNKWQYAYTIYSGTPFRVPKQVVLTQITKINQNEIQLSIFTKILEAISTDLFQELSQRKKYLIYSIKDYFDNFFTPPQVNCSNNNNNNSNINWNNTLSNNENFKSNINIANNSINDKK